LHDLVLKFDSNIFLAEIAANCLVEKLVPR
jgi:hypothetical protein